MSEYVDLDNRETSEYVDLDNKDTTQCELELKRCLFSIEGMTCGSCVNIISSYMNDFPGVISVKIALITKQAEILFNPLLESKESIIEKIEELGYEARFIGSVFDDEVSLIFDEQLGNIQGGFPKLKSSIMEVGGVLDVIADPKTNTIVVKYDQNRIGIRDLLTEISTFEASYSVFEQDGVHYCGYGKELEDQFNRLVWCSFFFVPSLILMVLMYIPHLSELFMKKTLISVTVADLLQLSFSTPIQFYFGRKFYYKLWRAIKSLNGDMDVLIALGTSAAYLYSVIEVILGIVNVDYVPQTFFDTSAMLISVVFIGKYFETLAKDRTSNTLKRLAELYPDYAFLVKSEVSGNAIEEVDCVKIKVGMCQVGDHLKVFPGSKIPVDGIVVYGNSFVDQSSITGEGVPVEVGVDSQVIAGTINQNGTLIIRALRVGKRTHLSMIIDYVNKAQTQKAPIELMIDKLSKIIIPLVIFLSIVTFVVWLSLSLKQIVRYPEGTSPVFFSLLHAISVIVISCPCALFLSAPTAILISTGIGAQNGIIIKNSKCLELAHKIKFIVFDKTGTLTLGSPSITHFETYNVESIKWTPRQLQNVIVNIEQMSEHPLAKSIVTQFKVPYDPPHAQQEPLTSSCGDDRVSISNFAYHPGMGIKCTVYDKNTVLIGNRTLMKQENASISHDIEEKCSELQDSSYTCSLVAVDGNCVALIALSDLIRPEARSVIQYLKLHSISSWMITGDSKRIAIFISRQLGIENVMAEMLPIQKAEAIKSLKSSSRDAYIAMVGDGINDSPALTVADMGVAINTAIDLTTNSADIVLLKNDLRDVIIALDLAKKTYSIIKLNYFWALIYNLLAIPMAAGALYPLGITITPIFAGILMVLSSITVLLFSLSLKRYKPPTL